MKVAWTIANILVGRVTCEIVLMNMCGGAV